MVTMKERNQLDIQSKIQKAMRNVGADGLILTELGSIYYATGHYSGFTKQAGKPGYAMAVIPAEGEITVIMSEYEVIPGFDQVPGCRIEVAELGIWIDGIEKITGKPAPTKRNATVDSSKTFRMALDMLKSRKSDAKIGIQMGQLTYDAMIFFKENGGECTFFDCEPLMDRVRMIKTPWEIEVLRTAAQLSEKAMNATASEIREGMSVFDIKNLYHRKCLEQSSMVTDASPLTEVGPCYSNFVISPDYTVKEGDLVRFDCGPVYLGYCSDICRTFSLGKASEIHKKIYANIANAYQLQLSMIKPGVRIADVYTASHQAVIDGGVPNYLRGHMGHSIGVLMLTEEYPYIAPSAGDEVFQPNMVFSAEVPYNSVTHSGLTLEDTLVITESGHERFTHCPLEIVEI